LSVEGLTKVAQIKIFLHISLQYSILKGIFGLRAFDRLLYKESGFYSRPDDFDMLYAAQH